MTTTPLSIGFIGLGVMGAPMAGHLAGAGHALTVLDADADRTRAVARKIGGRVARTPAEVAAASDIVVTMLPDGRVVQQVALGADGLVHGLRAGALLLDTSSAEPWLTEATAAALAKAGATMVDAPVSGAAWGAEAAELVFMVGGSDAEVARVMPLLKLMGKAQHHLGGLGAGHAMKCINNTITSMTFLATAEGLVAGKRYGLDPEAMLAVLNQSTGGSWITQTHFTQRIFNRAFDDPFKLALMLKDIGIALQVARDTGTPMPLCGLGQQLWRMAPRARPRLQPLRRQLSEQRRRQPRRAPRAGLGGGGRRPVRRAGACRPHRARALPRRGVRLRAPLRPRAARPGERRRRSRRALAARADDVQALPVLRRDAGAHGARPEGRARARCGRRRGRAGDRAPQPLLPPPRRPALRSRRQRASTRSSARSTAPRTRWSAERATGALHARGGGRRRRAGDGRPRAGDRRRGARRARPHRGGRRTRHARRPPPRALARHRARLPRQPAQRSGAPAALRRLHGLRAVAARPDAARKLREGIDTLADHDDALALWRPLFACAPPAR